MANELKLNISATLRFPASPSTGQVPETENISQTFSLAKAAVGKNCGVLTVPTTAGGTVLPVGSITTNGWLFMVNLDQTNYVTYGPTVSGAIVVFGKMKANEPAVIRVDPTVTVRLLANTASCPVQFYFLQD